MADKCTPVTSSWLTHVGTWRGSRFCVFKKKGICCWYPNTNDNYYRLVLTYASKGHFVHEWLWKILPYKIIQNPCPAILGAVGTNCCANLIPSTVHVTLTSAGACGCFSGSYPLTWNAAAQFWHYIGTVCGGRGFSFQFRSPRTHLNGFSLPLAFRCRSPSLVPN